MGAQLRIVRRRIRSVQSTKKITRAMELIASSRIVKAQQRVESSRPYAVQPGDWAFGIAALDEHSRWVDSGSEKRTG